MGLTLLRLISYKAAARLRGDDKINQFNTNSCRLAQ